jgi:phytoene/squalene synthetase
MENRRYRESYQLTKKYGTSYFIATLLMDSQSRKHVYALYSMCRFADDLVDVADGKPGTSAQARENLAAFKADVFSAIKQGCRDENLLGAIAKTWNELELDMTLAEKFFASMEMDLDVTRYETHDDLEGYTDGSAAVIGEMVLPILEKDSSRQDHLRTSARNLGFAFQLTNFLRDVGEDLERGRLYIPLKSCADAGVDPDNIVYNQAFIDMMKTEIAYTKGIYHSCREGVLELTGRPGACVRTAYRLYGGILEEIEKANYDVLSQRVRVSKASKYAIASQELLRIRKSAFKESSFI